MTKEQIELACLEEAHRRFTQAMDMPMLQQTMTLGIGLKDINSPAFQEILDGTFKCPLHCEPTTQRLLQQLAQPKGIENNQPQSMIEMCFHTIFWKHHNPICRSIGQLIQDGLLANKVMDPFSKKLHKECFGYYIQSHCCVQGA